MENESSFLEPLYDKAENYVKTSLHLYKLKTIHKSVNILSTIVSRGVAFILFSIFIITANIGVSLWLGDLLGKSYYGFFCVAGFYAIAGMIAYFILHKDIKKRIGNSVVSNLLD